jgi:threonylcarbamoyladenosine tRNA methylthiotransferase MtaB
LQSGNDEILQAMKRKYERKVFADRVLKIKNLLPHACIAADVIVGFPGETDEHFSDTYHFIDSLDISCLHVFSYSERPGTFATGLKGHLNPIVKQARSKKLHELSEQKLQRFYQQNKGLATKVLFESDRIKGYMYGFTENYIKVKTRYNYNLINTIIEVQLDELDEDAYVFKP